MTSISRGSEISLPRKVAYAALTVGLVAFLLLSALLALDVYLHHRVQYVAGFNVWGYRGPVASRKRPGEIRIAAIGGSTVFGFGLPWNEAWPYYLERQLNAKRPGRVPVAVVNLGVPADSARTFVMTMNDYSYLKYDIVILYEGYNDLDPGGRSTTTGTLVHYLAWRHQSPIFRWTGYFPIFPLVLSEKAILLMHGGDWNAAYGSRQVVFKPGLATRATAGAMKAAADIGTALERRLGRLTKGGFNLSNAYDENCDQWSQYCGAMEAAIRRALDRGQQVLVATQPYISDLHVDQQRALAASLRRQFGPDPRVRYVNLGRLLDLRDPKIAYDHMHLTANANEKVAEALSQIVLEMIK